jgi:restriction system protein
MGVPGYQTVMRPPLNFAQDGGEKNIGEAINAIADQFNLSEQERSQLVPSGKQSLLANRVHWVACTRFRRHRVRCFYGTGG